MSKVSDQTFMLTKALTHLKNASIYIEVILNEQTVAMTAKQFLKRIKQRADMAIRDFNSVLTPESIAVLETHVLNDDTALQLDEVSNMFIALPQGIRDQIETYVLGMYNVYSLNDKK